MSAAVAAVLTKVTGFSTSNVIDMGATGNRGYEILDTGPTRCAVVRPPLNWTRGRSLRVEGFGEYDTLWQIEVELFYQVSGNEGAALSSLASDMGLIIDELDKYSLLDGTTDVFDSKPVRGEGPYYVEDKRGSGPHYVMVTLHVEVIENVSVAFAG
jgi:hypothetical protein